MHRHPARLLLMQRSTFSSAPALWTRRSFVGAGLAAAATGVLAACAAPAPSAAPTSTVGAAAAAAKPAQSTGELKMAIDGEVPATLDATKNPYQPVRLGMAQTLT